MLLFFSSLKLHLFSSSNLYKLYETRLLNPATSSFILFYFISFYFILLYFILFYIISFYFILFHFISFHFILFYFILGYFVLFYFILFYFILSYFILFHFILFYSILFYLIVFSLPTSIIIINFICFLYFHQFPSSKIKKLRGKTNKKTLMMLQI